MRRRDFLKAVAAALAVPGLPAPPPAVPMFHGVPMQIVPKLDSLVGGGPLLMQYRDRVMFLSPTGVTWYMSKIGDPNDWDFDPA